MSGSSSKQTVSVLGALPGFAVMIGGSLALAGASLAGLGATVRALRDGRRSGMASTAAVLATGVYALKVRPWMLRWGATRAESEATLPGDELAPRPGVGPTGAVTVDAPVEAVWSWLAQIGQDRGGFYSYEWLENLAGCRMRNAERIHPQWQIREAAHDPGVVWTPLVLAVPPASSSCLRATASPACQPGARPPAGG